MTDGEECCPSCGSPDRIPIVYGLPTQETVQRAARGEVGLSGCLVDDRTSSPKLRLYPWARRQQEDE